ncbi:hypothetical protein K439DRAFT_1411821 [Ramaria rubella]|nr:hypothetical protein K439DRAFT_1665633 [Ramaria rubella]KAF8583710.1 hypothetical protein K439DRAFT_1411821 [Ramaria rubella]
MKTLSAAAAVFAASAAVSASSLARDADHREPYTVGAAYFITNEPGGNYVVSTDIGSDGKLNFKTATSAGGRGAHGVPNGLDPFFSQGAIEVSGQYVFTVNAGSNTAVMFAIDKREPSTLRMVGYPVGTGGDFPMSVAVSKPGGQVCIVNGGASDGVNCFNQDPNLGLVEIANTRRSLGLNQTTPPSGPPGAVSNIVFTPDGSQLLVSVKGIAPAPGYIASWGVDAATGALSENFIKYEGGALPFSMAFIPGKNALLATDPGAGFDIFDFTNGQKASVTKYSIPGQKATCWSSYSSLTGNFYLTDATGAIVTEVHVNDQLKASIVKQYPQGNGTGTLDGAIGRINQKDNLFILAAGATSINVMTLDAPGEVTPVEKYNFSNELKKARVSFDSDNLQGMAVFIGN